MTRKNIVNIGVGAEIVSGKVVQLSPIGATGMLFDLKLDTETILNVELSLMNRLVYDVEYLLCLKRQLVEIPIVASGKNANLLAFKLKVWIKVVREPGLCGRGGLGGLSGGCIRAVTAGSKHERNHDHAQQKGGDSCSLHIISPYYFF